MGLVFRGVGAALLGYATVLLSQLLWLLPELLTSRGVPGVLIVGSSAVFAGVCAAVLAHLGVRALAWPRLMRPWVSAVYLAVGGVVLAVCVTLLVRAQHGGGLQAVVSGPFMFFVRGAIPLSVVAWPLLRYRTSVHAGPPPAGAGE